jgi:hypothetical protein
VTRYRVKWRAGCTVRTSAAPMATGATGSGGRGVLTLSMGALLPPDVDQAQIDHLIAGGFIEPVGGPAQPLT